MQSFGNVQVALFGACNFANWESHSTGDSTLGSMVAVSGRITIGAFIVVSNRNISSLYKLILFWEMTDCLSLFWKLQIEAM